MRACLVTVAAMLIALTTGAARADNEEKTLPSATDKASEKAAEKERWHGPFGGTFSAAFTVVSDYSFAGISQTNRQPAFQPSLSYRTPSVSDTQNLWAYLSVWGSNINFNGVGPSIEVDLSGGLKWRTLNNRLSFDLGYVQYLYPGVPAQYAYEYGEFYLSAAYDFGFAQLAGRVRHSLNAFGDSGSSWSERALLSVCLLYTSPSPRD